MKISITAHNESQIKLGPLMKLRYFIIPYTVWINWLDCVYSRIPNKRVGAKGNIHYEISYKRIFRYIRVRYNGSKLEVYTLYSIYII